ncbi:uncharacterized protein MEPE_06390 [Melanopsichium pennsylvanicum]|uniref:Uncharacterized protein n=2 Tax=Melanopsichium pennsylvanicum TaxID=63383 RepID=A0AAJ4XRS6_9BASI|nr:hypothetical protein BN887_02796 [Melanopsichium pennsylvanicum 4]SNX87680.1 uncharacterized protein MEPE_06390 [Melanopsichium pennsylvanicum]
MVSLSYSAPAPSHNDPIFIRTHFLSRVASDASGLEYQHELLKRRSSRHSDLNRWDSNWLAPVTNVLDYDSDDTSDTDDDVLDMGAQHKSMPAHHLRSRSSTLPFTLTMSAPVEMARARSMTAPLSFASSFDTRPLRKNGSTIGRETRLMPARPLTIDTAQPLRFPSLNVSTIGEPSCAVNVPSPISAVAPSSKTCSPPFVPIECSESDGSCHGDAGDQDPEAQLAAGIVRLREQRRPSSCFKSSRRTISKRRSPAQSSGPTNRQQPKLVDDADSDDAQSLVIRRHGGSFVLRLAEMVLDFGSCALEKLVIPDRDECVDTMISAAQQSPTQPRTRSSTTPKELIAEAGELLRRRRERIGSLLPHDSVAESDSTGKATLMRSWSVPKLLGLPLFNPSASLRALSSSTDPTPATPTSAPIRLLPDFTFTSATQRPSKYSEFGSFDDVGTFYSKQSLSLSNHSSSFAEVVADPSHVSPLWKQ